MLVLVVVVGCCVCCINNLLVWLLVLLRCVGATAMFVVSVSVGLSVVVVVVVVIVVVDAVAVAAAVVLAVVAVAVRLRLTPTIGSAVVVQCCDFSLLCVHVHFYLPHSVWFCFDQGGQWRKALVLLHEMEVLDCLPPNMHCMNSAIDACGKVYVMQFE